MLLLLIKKLNWSNKSLKLLSFKTKWENKIKNLSQKLQRHKIFLPS